MQLAGCLLLLLLGCTAQIYPGDNALPLVLPTVSLRNGHTAGNFTFEPSSGAIDPILFLCYNNNDSFSSAMFVSEVSVLAFLNTFPNNSHLVVMSYDEEAKEEVTTLGMTLMYGVHLLKWPEERVRQFESRIHLVSWSIPALSEHPSTAWLPAMLSNWTSVSAWIQVLAPGHSGGAPFNITAPRMDSRYAWLPWPTASNVPLWFAPDCANVCALATLSAVPAQAVVLLPGYGCPIAQSVMKAQNAGASAVLFYARNDELHDINCEGQQCGWNLDIPASLVTRTTGLQLIQALQQSPANSTFLSYLSLNLPGFNFAINSASELVQIGYVKVATLEFFSWAAQYENHMMTLRFNLSQPALVVPILPTTEFGGYAAVQTVIPSAIYAQFPYVDEVWLDFALSCLGHFDMDCSMWDRTSYISVCCDGDTSCVPPLKPGTPLGPHIGEIGRWVTPFRRRVGRWLTEITPLLALFTSANCSVVVGDDVDGTGDIWVGTANLRLVTPQLRAAAAAAAAAMATPAHVRLPPPPITLPRVDPGRDPLDVERLRDMIAMEAEADTKHDGGIASFWPSIPRTPPTLPLPPSPVPAVAVQRKYLTLWNGGWFTPTYNTNRPTVVFQTADSTLKVELVTVITGHGADNVGCAEFCPTSHEVVLNQVHNYVQSFNNAGTQWGCTLSAPYGGIPNEHGTWFYGRDGWCDGQNVPPFVQDITLQLNPAGVNNTLQYFGWFNGSTPLGSGGAYIVMSSYLVFTNSLQ